jgi:predicted Rossmann fold flavoprotein
MSGHPSAEVDVLVVGAGAAGIFAAWRAAQCGARTLLLEKTERLGTKILISGGGRCNITHAGTVEEVLRPFRRNEAQFLRPSMYRFTNEDVLNLLTRRGLKVCTRPNGRVFPETGTAKDVVARLRQLLDEAGVRTLFGADVKALEMKSGRVTGVQSSRGLHTAGSVVLAAGGSSYPATGTTGDAWEWCRSLGHEIVKVRAALAPIYLKPAPPAAWSGVALRDVVLKARRNGREFVRWREDLLFTHKGISGPTALGISREVAEQMELGEVLLEVDIVPNMPFEEIGAKVDAWCAENPRRRIAGFVEDLMPARLVEPLLSAAGIESSAASYTLGVKGRNRLVEALKGWRLPPVSTVPLEKGEVVAGGVSLAEVDARTMASRKAGGLFLCGELLDVAGPVGGYNLQAAFSTGYVAGESAAADAAAMR